MKIETYYPKHVLLKDVIEYYYFQRTDAEDFSMEYHAFPNIFIPLNIHRNVSCNINGHQVIVNGVKPNNHLMILNGRYVVPLHVQQKGKIDKVTIVSKPLGFNHFITSPFCEIAQKPTQIFTDWINTTSCQTFLNLFFIEQDNSMRILLLENYLLLLYKPFSEYGFLNDIVNMLCDFSKETSIEDIAKICSLSSRTLNRQGKRIII